MSDPYDYLIRVDHHAGQSTIEEARQFVTNLGPHQIDSFARTLIIDHLDNIEATAPLQIGTVENISWAHFVAVLVSGLLFGLLIGGLAL